ncbi:MAG TPA: S8 family serine peptidase [Ideonella sp.]|uniref:S8 family peptidase n=1 Tax=Ideonella sp. TaxID=1929293 RepID=UPI002E37AB0E|nr:S8 family serine peptidase [Ideonella sp.]HEX5685484.1 S8 family serine peptidase [Ideonella sp.]
MKQIRKTLLATAAAAALTLVVGGVHAAPQSVAAKAAEQTDHWFVEFNSVPTIEGAKLDKVRGEKAAFRKAAQAAGIKFKERRSFDVLFNGVSITAGPAERAKIARLPGVKAMYPVEVIHAPKPIRAEGDVQPQLDTALSMTGADVLQGMGISGTGIKVGIIDTGVDIDHAALGGGGVPGGNSFPTTRVAYGYDFVGDAFNADPNSPGYNPVPVPDENPDDCGGHGTHVAGIVGASGALTGVAPNVTFGAYRVFGCAGSTTADVMIAAMERALADGMQVVNQSIGSSFQWPEYPSAKAADRLVKAGVVMVASIGNSGTSGLYAAGAPGVGKHVIGVASFDNSHSKLSQFAISPDASAIGYQPATGAPTPPTSGSQPMSRTGTVATTDDACAPLTPGSLTGTVALIRRGTCSFYQKAFNAQTAGAAGVVLYNNVPGRINPTVVGTPAITIPVVSVSDAEGALIDSRLAGGAVDMTWSADLGSFPNVTGGLISSFSSYGLAADLSVKPNIGAPGGMIYSTYPLELGGYATLSGTSMSSPHTAGGAALLLQANPKINAMSMRDRMQNAADPKAWQGNPGLGFLDQVHRQGAGMLDLVQASQSTTMVQPGELALGESQAGPVTRTLTFKNSGKTAVTYDLSHASALATGPNSFTVSAFDAPATVAFSAASVTVPAKGTASVDVTVTAPEGLADKSLFGGYVVATSQADGKVMRVPFAGMKGDYQSIQVLTPTANGFPWLAKLSGGSFTNQPGGATYTMAGDDIPYFLVHLDHQSRQMKLEAFDAVTNKNMHLISLDTFLPRNSTATGFFNWAWDGTTFKKGGTPTPVPNGTYVVKLSLLKALGDANNAADWETWTSPAVTIARP